MKGDFSRISFDPRKRYTGVLQQQGRAQLDADWNEQVEIDSQRGRELVRDVVGACGAPNGDAGFEVSLPGDGEIAISRGRIYVGGTLCQLEAEATYSGQPDLPRPPATPRSDGQTLVVYLDVWERHVTWVEDPDILEPALGGPDTTTRKRTVAQVKLLPVPAGGDCERPIDGWPPAPSGGCLASRMDFGTEPTGIENKLYRVEIHEPGPPGTATYKWSRDNGSVVFAVREFLEGENDDGLVAARVEAHVPAERLGLGRGDWVELIGEESELSLVPGRFIRVARVHERDRIVWLEGDISHHRHERLPKLRRWDGKAGAQTVGPGWLRLEDGIGIGTVERAAEPPRGIRHDYCKLALLTWEKQAGERWSATVVDCRPLFEPLGGAGHERCVTEIAGLRTMLEAQARELAELREATAALRVDGPELGSAPGL